MTNKKHKVLKTSPYLRTLINMKGLKSHESQKEISETNVLKGLKLKSRKNDMLLLLLSRFSRVRPCATPWTAAHQAPLSLGFSRREHWRWLPWPFPLNDHTQTPRAAKSRQGVLLGQGLFVQFLQQLAEFVITNFAVLQSVSSIALIRIGVS